jgi:hypothetical protein
MNSKEIILPEGWSVDKIENGKIILKESTLDTWGKCVNKVFSSYRMKYIDSGSEIHTVSTADVIIANRNMMPEEYAEPMLALMQLLTCYKAWVGDWKPDWKNHVSKHCIYVENGRLQKRTWVSSSQHPLIFPTADMRDKFFETFKNLIKQAKPLL